MMRLVPRLATALRVLSVTAMAAPLGLPLSGAVWAQTAGGGVVRDSADKAPAEAQMHSQVLAIDSERFFRQSAFGLRVIADYQTALRALDTENTQIAQQLREEEQALTAQRPQLSAEDFSRMADAFHAKVQNIRQEQSAKQQLIEARLDLSERRFLEAAFPVVEALMIERGAAIIVEKRNVYATNLSIEITDDVIARINVELGDGRETLGVNSGADSATETSPQAEAPATE